MHQVATVEKWNDGDAGRQDVSVELLHFGVNRFEGRIDSAPFLKRTMPSTTSPLSMIAVERVNRLPDWPRRILGPCGDNRDVLNTHRRAVFRGNDRLLNVVDLSSPARPLRTLICCNPASIKLPPRVDVVVGERPFHLRQRQPIGDSLFGSRRT